MQNQPKLNAIIIGVNNIKKAKEFYINVFGINVKREDESYLSSYIGDTHIELETDSEFRFPNWKKNNVGNFKCSEFSVPDLNLFLETVKRYGGRIISEPTNKPWGTTNAEIADIDGNIFMIVEELK